MVTYLGAACDLSLAHIEQPHVWSLVEKAQVFILHAAFLPQFNTKEVNEMISYSGIVFGNESEAAAFGDAHSLTDKTIHAARYIADLPFADGEKRKRLVIITQGKDPIIYTDSTDPTVHQYVVEQLKDEEMVDTNGAGDSFAAGFIADYIRGKPMITSLQSGVRAAAYIIRRSGFSLGSRESSAFKINL
ncbi:adenosine kinase [Schistosoma bovis]|uniref:Adenosine kinase n=1 Tax=Schistosoma bovis TaxID=6184 RepID=A0A430PXA3_SCHBO|nr:adenosine kinase [Schistosoma bovis]